ncbi:jg24460 [Pararge aegeria aegeria]|uniref:Jg24460 protein n=1 Tax=Pararge aegeria aegeria TaxID=348720 RepID=A0A8S4RM12_9NEOP|nr:jg24460 [Pararge aegeria aegeria]
MIFVSKPPASTVAARPSVGIVRGVLYDLCRDSAIARALRAFAGDQQTAVVLDLLAPGAQRGRAHQCESSEHLSAIGEKAV